MRIHEGTIEECKSSMVNQIIELPLIGWSAEKSFSPSLKRSRMASGPTSVTCSKGHVHPPWSTTGILRIAKCESVCGFCQKETKTAANLRKHVAIHIKNEGLNLTIAEGSSGRGRLEMPTLTPNPSTSSRLNPSASNDNPDQNILSPLTPLAKRHQFTPWSDRSDAADHVSSTALATRTSHLTRALSTPISPHISNLTHPHPHPHNHPPTYPSPDSTPHSALQPYLPNTHALTYTLTTVAIPTAARADPFRPLRDRNLSTKPAWTVIPASEGFRILDLCKNLSVVHEEGERAPTPCYNRETIFDEEWQAHMKDVHGVFLLWPETWMRRIEVLDLDAFGGDIGVCNEVIMDVRD